MNVFPLIFEPIYKPKLWGGRRMESVLGKKLPGGQPIGESWELADLPGAESRVAAGPAKGRTLAHIMADWGPKLTGRAPLADGRFPLLLKFLDARETLSVQVHPDAATAARLGGDTRVKNEAWYIVAAEPNAHLYRGVQPGVDESGLRRALADGTVEQLLVKIPARKGHAIFLPSGTIHALGTGVLVAEVQTPSDTTYRLFDWNRADPATGSPRELHIEQALACASYAAVPPGHERIEHSASVWTSVTSLIRCASFVIERVRMVEGVEQPIPYAEMVIWMVLEGGGRVSCQGLPQPIAFQRGDTVLLPAAMKDATVATAAPTMWLEVTLPVPSSLADYKKPDPADLRRPPPGPDFVPLGTPG